MSSPQPPHLNCPSGGWRGNEPQAHCFKIPEEHPRATTRVSAAEVSAYTQACSLVPNKKLREIAKISRGRKYISSLKKKKNADGIINREIDRVPSAGECRSSYNSTCAQRRLADRLDCWIVPPPKRRASLLAAAGTL